MTVNYSIHSVTKLQSGLRASARRWPFTGWENGLFALWLLTMIALPIAKYFWADLALTWGVFLGVVFQVSLVLAILYRAGGVAGAVRIAVLVTLLTWLAEAIGTATSWPFGAYNYTPRLQPQLAQVPLLIPVAWLMMLPSAWAVAYQVAGRWSGPLFVAVSALALTAWDLFLDPQMVAWGLWVWSEPGGYFGIPWLNFMGWLLTAALITIVVRPRDLPVAPLLAIYVVTWLLESIGLFFFWGLPGPAVVGFVAMGSLIWLAWWVHQKQSQLYCDT